MRALAAMLVAVLLLSGCAATRAGQDPNPWPKRLLIGGVAVIGVGMLVAAGFAGARRSEKSTTTKCTGGIYASKCTTTYRGF